MTRGDDDAADLDRLADGWTDPAAAHAIRRGYLRWLPAAGRVLDVGCGCGAMLDLLRESGRRACGVDRSAAAASACRARGHDARCGDATQVLAAMRRDGERFDAAVLAHVVEHLQPGAALGLLRAIAALLAPGAPLVVVTPDFRSLIVATELFWLDPTHARPYPAALIERLGDAAGFDARARYGDPRSRPPRPFWRAALARLRSAASGADRSGPLDLVVVLTRRSPAGGGADGGVGGGDDGGADPGAGATGRL